MFLRCFFLGEILRTPKFTVLVRQSECVPQVLKINAGPAKFDLLFAKTLPPLEAAKLVKASMRKKPVREESPDLIKSREEALAKAKEKLG